MYDLKFLQSFTLQKTLITSMVVGIAWPILSNIGHGGNRWRFLGSPSCLISAYMKGSTIIQYDNKTCEIVMCVTSKLWLRAILCVTDCWLRWRDKQTCEIVGTTPFSCAVHEGFIPAMARFCPSQ